MGGLSVISHVSGEETAPSKVATVTDSAIRRDGNASKHTLGPVLSVARSSLQSLESVKDYEGVFVKRERLKPRGKLQTQTMQIKLRQEPFSVYLKYRDVNAGREVIFVDGLNKGHFLVHEDGLRSIAGTLSFLPDGPEVMNENRYPLTKIGMKKMLETLIEQWEGELAYDEVELKYFPSARIGTIECKLIETSHPQPRSHFKFHKTALYLDKSNNLPIRVEQYGFPEKARQDPPLIEEYSYTELKVNVGLTDEDFDTKNKAYSF